MANKRTFDMFSYGNYTSSVSLSAYSAAVTNAEGNIVGATPTVAGQVLTSGDPITGPAPSFKPAGAFLPSGPNIIFGTDAFSNFAPYSTDGGGASVVLSVAPAIASPTLNGVVTVNGTMTFPFFPLNSILATPPSFSGPITAIGPGTGGVLAQSGSTAPAFTQSFGLTGPVTAFGLHSISGIDPASRADPTASISTPGGASVQLTMWANNVKADAAVTAPAINATTSLNSPVLKIASFVAPTNSMVFTILDGTFEPLTIGPINSLLVSAGSTASPTFSSTLSGLSLVTPNIASAVFTGTLSGTAAWAPATLTAASPVISGTVTGGATYNAVTFPSPTITGTVGGGASYTSPSLTGTVGGSASYTTPTLTSPTITGTVGGGASYTSPTLTGTVAGGANYSGITLIGTNSVTGSFGITRAASNVEASFSYTTSSTNWIAGTASNNNFFWYNGASRAELTPAGLLTVGSLNPGVGSNVLPYINASSVVAAVAGNLGSASQSLVSTGPTTAPAWSLVSLTAGVTGTLPVANGGTGTTTSTGSGSTVLSASPTLTGTVTVASITATGSVTVLRAASNVEASISYATGSTNWIVGTASDNNYFWYNGASRANMTPAGLLSLTALNPGIGINHLPYTNSVGTVAAVAGNLGVAGQSLLSAGPTTAPVWGAPIIPLTTGVSGVLPVANGGTGTTTSTGSGSTVLSASPTLTGTTTVDSIIATGSVTVQRAAANVEASISYATGSTNWIVGTANDNTFFWYNAGPRASMTPTGLLSLSSLNPGIGNNHVSYTNSVGTVTAVAGNLGVVGQNLRSTGPTTAPVWAHPPIPNVLFYGSGINIPYTTPANARYITVTLVGGGGGGFPSQSGGAGGSGGYVHFYYDVATLGSINAALSVGSGGATSTSGNNTQIAAGIFTVYAAGGGGGLPLAGGAGGVVSIIGSGFSNMLSYTGGKGSAPVNTGTGYAYGGATLYGGVGATFTGAGGEAVVAGSGGQIVITEYF